VQANAVRLESSGFLVPGLLHLDIDAPDVRVEIPADYLAIKANDPGLAMEWRLVIRQVLEAYLAAEYVVVGFSSRESEIGRRSYYLLRRGPG
jgi:predicted GNAT superfamily acetyltransferase